jgi:hypothetical protein
VSFLAAFSKWLFSYSDHPTLLKQRARTLVFKFGQLIIGPQPIVKSTITGEGV